MQLGTKLALTKHIHDDTCTVIHNNTCAIVTLTCHLFLPGLITSLRFMSYTFMLYCLHQTPPNIILNTLSLNIKKWNAEYELSIAVL